MSNLKKSATIAWIGVGKLMCSPRLYLLIGMMIVIVYDAMQPIKEFCILMGHRVTPWVYTFLLRDGSYYGIVILLGLVLLFCDAPFLDAGQALMITRSGKKCWCIGQLLYIVICTGLYFMILFFIQCINLMPLLTTQINWGKIITTLVHSDMRIGSLSFPQQVVQNSPGAISTLLTFGAHWMAGSLLGMTMFLINLKYKRQMGAVIGTGIILLRSLVGFLGGSKLGMFVFAVSPFSFIRPENYKSTIHISGIFAVLWALLLLLAVASQKTVSSGDMQTLPEI